MFPVLVNRSPASLAALAKTREWFQSFFSLIPVMNQSQKPAIFTDYLFPSSNLPSLSMFKAIAMVHYWIKFHLNHRSNHLISLSFSGLMHFKPSSLYLTVWAVFQINKSLFRYFFFFSSFLSLADLVGHKRLFMTWLLPPFPSKPKFTESFGPIQQSDSPNVTVYWSLSSLLPDKQLSLHS